MNNCIQCLQSYTLKEEEEEVVSEWSFLYSAIFRSLADSLRFCHMWFWMTDYSLLKRVFEYPPKWCTYSVIWFLHGWGHGWGHVKLLPSRHISGNDFSERGANYTVLAFSTLNRTRENCSFRPVPDRTTPRRFAIKLQIMAPSLQWTAHHSHKT